MNYTSNEFEIVIQIRDGLGNPTGRTKFFGTDRADKLYDFWIRNAVKKRPLRKNRKKKEKLPDKEQADKILKNLYSKNK